MGSRAGRTGELVLLDACCLINLFGAGRAEEILAALPFRFAVARYVVEEEILEIETAPGAETPPEAESRRSLRPLLADLIAKGVLERLDVAAPEEEAELVRFAAELDDGEAHTCALAIVRGARVATDDRKAIRVLRQAWRQRGETTDPVLRTSDLLLSWARAKDIADRDLSRIVHSIATRARFIPPKDDPHRRRWRDLLDLANANQDPASTSR